MMVHDTRESLIGGSAHIVFCNTPIRPPMKRAEQELVLTPLVPSEWSLPLMNHCDSLSNVGLDKVELATRQSG
jgi:hypothetical protein